MTYCVARQMSGPVPSPSMKGMMGSSGTTIAPSWYSIRVPLIARATLHNDAATRHAPFRFGQLVGGDAAHALAGALEALDRARARSRGDERLADAQHVRRERLRRVDFDGRKERIDPLRVDDHRLVVDGRDRRLEVEAAADVDRLQRHKAGELAD